ncbi:hypothetical protein C8N35_101404 [Breoghania corrubedonensis]|uniref:Uncharacterized protein n=1 Tax=Breoghania corrubedonensis TaxID=665038 RepID=A0A2T5VF36_9HYPH|nr:hypothetical protein C8N35_101404 [Breoghania corrubedonensis]
MNGERRITRTKPGDDGGGISLRFFRSFANRGRGRGEDAKIARKTGDKRRAVRLFFPEN